MPGRQLARLGLGEQLALGPHAELHDLDGHAASDTSTGVAVRTGSLPTSGPARAQPVRLTEYTHFYTQACALGAQYGLAQEHPCNALAKRLLPHLDELFPFVLIAGLPADNNLAERSLRPLVIMRKISGGSRSAEGAKTRLTLVSLLYIWVARHLNPFVECLMALQQPTATAPPQTPLP